MGGNEYGQSGRLSNYTLFEALYDAFEVEFLQGFIFTPYQRNW